MDDYFSQTAGNPALDQRSAIYTRHGGFDATLGGLALSWALRELDRAKGLS
ncbi:hypothetical protein [Noviherbaspirillum soli]|uniref:hypothetical protein n=1 Tax=Noviherbaspirillum soli TaxID=1064518 RepID=UPI00188A2EEB|nr:hypothetical protein [Noviherbaspirillum soli]